MEKTAVLSKFNFFFSCPTDKINHNLDLNIKVKVLRCYVFLSLFYGVDSWIMTQATKQTLKAFQMWVYKRILRMNMSKGREKKTRISGRYNAKRK